MSSTSAPCKERRLAALSRSRAIFSIVLLVPLVVLHIHSQKSFTGVFQQGPMADSSTVQEALVRQEDGKAIAGPAHQPDRNKDTQGHSEKFNYTAFWQDAMEKATRSLESETKQAQAPCPKVYVYDLPSNLLDKTSKSTSFGGEVTLKGDKDKIFRDYLHKTHQYSFPSILEERLRSSKQCRTLDPDEADLFYAPVLPASKGIDEWDESCRDVTGEMVRDGLSYLNSTNACRHFFAVGKGHVDVHHCDGWFSNPIKELIPVQRLAYSNYSFVIDSNGAHRYVDNDTTDNTYPNLASVPYPSSLHFRKSKTGLPHLSANAKRNVLMSFVGKYNHGDIQVRELIHKMCSGYKNESICDFVPKYHAKDMPKARAIFCLEPAGDTPGRKSLSDSITFGCIPVLFSELMDDVAPWFWLDWKDRGRILVPREEFVAGRIDLKRLLQSIPPALLDLMRTTLSEKARKFQFSLDDDQEDGVRVVLDNLHQQVLEKEQQGLCGYR